MATFYSAPSDVLLAEVRNLNRCRDHRNLCIQELRKRGFTGELVKVCVDSVREVRHQGIGE